MNIHQQLANDRETTLARLAALTRDLEALMAATADVPDDEHDPEGATIGFERAQVVALVTAARRHLAEIDAAEARLRAGTHGTCERCGEPMAEERLVARPTARVCVGCAEVAER
jgi:DnaK suppressor protein